MSTPRPYLLAESNWKAIKEQEFDLAVLPWGATEAHNYHMPYGTDIMEADAVGAEAGRLAWEKGAKITVLPTIPFGVNTGQDDIRLDINLNPSTQYYILKDVIDVLHRHNVNKLLVLNSHGGNDFKPMLRELGLKFPDMWLASCNWFQSLDKSRYFDYQGDHADEMETSVILYLKPDLVVSLDEAGDGSEKKSKIEGIREGWAWSERKWSMVTEDTGIGFPKAASKEKGKKYFRDVCEKVGQLFVEIANTDKNKRYE